MGKRLKVLYVVHEPRMYGANHSLLNLIDGLGKAIEPFVLLPSKGALSAELESRGISFFVENYRHAGVWLRESSVDSSLKFSLRKIYYRVLNTISTRRILKLIRDVKLDIVHSNTGVIDIGAKIAQVRSVKHVWHLREFQDVDHGFKLFYSKVEFKRKLAESDSIICITKAIKNYFDLADVASAQVIYNGVRSEKSELNEIKQDYFLFCGAVKKKKGIEDAIYAIAKLSTKENNIKLKIAGGVDPIYFEYLQGLVRSLGIFEKVEFLGYRSDVDDLIKNARALLMCSRNEAMGRVTAEAMLLGCPVIGFNNGGTAELIIDNENGLLYKDIADLVRCLIYIIESPTAVNDIVIKAQTFAEQHFTEKSYANKVYTIYQSLC